jgi:hypothetical protein
MVISKELKRELMAFMLTVSAMLVTKNIKDLEAILMILEKLVAIVKKEIGKDGHVVGVTMLPSDMAGSNVMSLYEHIMSDVLD